MHGNSRLSVDDFRDLLEASDVLTREEVALRPAGVSRPEACEAEGLLRPRTVEQVREILRRCHAAHQPLVVQGGNTGGAFSSYGEIILSTERMTHIEEIDVESRVAVVQSGCLLQSLHDAVRPLGLQYGVDYGGRGSATLGGNIATNAGGLNVMRYGSTREQVLGVEAVLADGTVIDSMNRMLKNNAGYDLKQLFIGTEGTLGVVTRAALRLRPLPLTENVAMAALAGFNRVERFLAHCEQRLAGSLTAYEVMWQSFYAGATAAGTAPLPAGFPFYVIVESCGATPDFDAGHFESVLQRALEEGLVEDAVVATSKAQMSALWDLRERVEWILRLPAWYVFDVSLPIRHMGPYVEGLERSIAERWADAEVVVFGHIADGNLHVFVTLGTKLDEAAAASLCEIVYRPLQAVRGSVAAEHGVGKAKVPYLHYTRTDEELALMRGLKQALDPHGILNPGRVVALPAAS